MCARFPAYVSVVRRLTSATSLALGATLLAAAQTAEPVAVTTAQGSTSVIIYAHDQPLTAATARKLADYLKLHTDVAVPVVATNALGATPPAATVILIDGENGHPLAARFGQTVQIPSDRPDAHRLAVIPRADGPAVILAAGRSAAGAKYAVYRLMRELEIQGREARIRPMEITVAPFIATRSAALFNVWSMPIELTRRHNTESWPVERLEAYVDMYDVFGFNAIESHDRFNDNYLQPLFGLDRAGWRGKVLRMSERARGNGQQFFLRIWGHSVMNTPRFTEPLGPTSAVPKRLTELCVNDPVERRRWEEEIRDYYVSHYAGRIDHLIGHWCDPGVCRRNGCDFRTPLKLQLELHRAFKAKDPKFSSSFSLWFFDVTKGNRAGWARGGWAGYETDHDLINAGILDREIVIATATMLPNSYQRDVVEAIVAAGHRPAVWTWYRADHEIRPSLHVHLHERLGEYFRGLPANARQLVWHNMERNVHGAANTANYYVAGRLMWEPELDVDALLREFLALTFGPENAAHIAPAYLAIERIRCHSCYKNWESSRHTGAGTADPRADLAMAESALAGLARVRIAPGHRSRLPLDLSREQILADLQASLEVIRDFARCRAEELPRVDAAFARGDAAAVQRLIEQLRDRYGHWTHSLAGRQEWSVLDAHLKTKLPGEKSRKRRGD